jgi:hypothetical protein
MLPWTWAIAWRRFNQGVLIRFGHAKVVGVGTAVRLGAGACVLVTGIVSQLVPGVMVAAAALSAGVLAEGLFIAWQERRLVRPIVEGLHTGEPPLRAGAFWAFYIPLALTPIVALVIQPIGTAAIGRMPEVEESLAVWLLVNGVVFVLQSFGLAYSEVVVALLNRPHAKPRLFAFMVAMAGATTCVLALLAFTPLGHIWFADVCGLEGRLLEMSTQSLWIALPIPACRAALSWYQGLLVNVRRTRPVTEAVVVFAIGCVAVLVAGVSLGRWPGLEVALAGFAVGRSLQTVWLAVRTRHLA